MTDLDLPFSRRYGYTPLPEPMRLEFLSDDLRRDLWKATDGILNALVCAPGWQAGPTVPWFPSDGGAKRAIERILMRYERIPHDEVPEHLPEVRSRIKKLILKATHNIVFDAIEDFLNLKLNDELERRANERSRCCHRYRAEVAACLEERAAAYYLPMKGPARIIPRSCKAQGEAAQKAIESLQEGGMTAAASHLRAAARHINAGQFSDSVTDSIHAVESVARTIDPKTSRTLSAALNSLKKSGVMKHPCLMGGIEKLYNYTCDEEGIRHAMIEKNAPDVDMDDAVFMFGACASGAAYLAALHRKRQAGSGG